MQNKIPDHDLSPGLLSLLPLFYVGWADSVLSPSEFKMIHQRINQLEFLDKKEKDLLISWTNPAYPPSPETFQWWIDQMKKNSQHLSDDDKASLVAMGLKLAQSSIQYKNTDIWKSPKTKNALREMQSALKIEAEESLDVVLHKIDVDATTKTTRSASFYPAQMQDILDATYTETRQRVRKLLRDPFFELQIKRDKADYRQLVLQWTKELAQQGLGAYAYPKEFGGHDKRGDHIVVFEMLGYHDLSFAVKFGVQFGLFGGAIYNLGTKYHHEKYLGALAKADLLGCFAMTETGHGSNVKGLETTLTYNPQEDCIIVHSPHKAAGKEYIGNALHSTMAVVFGQLIVGGKSHGIHAVAVPIRNENHQLLPGVIVEDNGYKMGLNGVDNGRLWFDQVKVPRSELLNKFGDINEKGEYSSAIESDSRRFFTMLSALVAGRICVALASISAAKKALYIATKYALKRRQFAAKKGEEETLILDYPTHQRRLFPRIAKTYGYDLALKQLTTRYVEVQDEEEQRKVETLAAGLKAMASWHATDTIQECREACGGKGYLHENQFADLKADTDIFTTFEGDNTVLLQLVAKGLLSDMQKLFHDEGYMAVMRYISGKLSQTMSEYNFYNSRRSDTEHLLDPDFYYDAFRYRRDKLLDQVSARMRRYLAKRIHPSDAFLRCQNHMVELAKAQIELNVLKAFYRQQKQLEEGPIKLAIGRLHQLYALSTIEENKGYYLENDYMNGTKTKAIRRVINVLLSEMRSDAAAYVEAFGIPAELVKAPIVV